MQRWTFPLNICLTFLIIAVLALITSDLISFRLAKLYPRSAKKTAAIPASATVAEDLMAFAPILEKGLFGKAAQGRLSPFVQAAAAKTGPTVSQGDLILLGTALGSFRETFALVQKASSKEERVFRLGETVFDMGPLVAVRKRERKPSRPRVGTGTVEMAFRRQRSEWDEFLKRHGPELRECGVPDYITRDRMRFFVCLEHGYDDWGHALSRPSTAWSPGFLTPEQAGRLAEFIARHFGEEQYRFLLQDLRRRATQA